MPVLDKQNAQQHNFVWQASSLIHIIARVSGLLWRWGGDHTGLRPFIGRYTSHTALVLLFTLLLIFSGLRWNVARPARVQTFHSQNVARTAGMQALLARSSYGASGQKAGPARWDDLSSPDYYMPSQIHILRRAEPETAIPERPRLDITTYVVQAGDTTEKIAELYKLQPTTIMWSNPEVEKAPDLLRIGQVLTILPVDGVYHTVKEGDTLESLAEKYKVSVTDIVNCTFNAEILEIQADLSDALLKPDSKLIIPGGTKPYQRREVTTYEGPAPEGISGSGSFYWPAAGYISQGYWYGHRAIDIADAVGAAIMATDDGYVSFAGWTDIGYGYLVVVDHANGYQTYYAHLSNIFVFEGEIVDAGQVIGAMGSTGNSTGPHLHFEIRYDGYPTNPLIYLP